MNLKNKRQLTEAELEHIAAGKQAFRIWGEGKKWRGYPPSLRPQPQPSSSGGKTRQQRAAPARLEV